MADLYRHKTFKNTNFEVLTDEGFKDFKGIIVGDNKDKLKLSFKSSKFVICTPKHKITLCSNGTYKYASELNVGDIIYGDEVVTSIDAIQNDDKVYELLHVADNHRYYANGILSNQCLILDELAFIEPHLVDDFWKSVYPIVSSSKKSKIFIASTANGTDNLFYKIYSGAEQGENGWASDKILWNEVPGRDEKWRQEYLASIDFDEEQFEQEMECQFLGSSGTLISGWKLKQLTYDEPISKNHGISMYEKPQENHSYVMVVDVSRGKGLDYSAFQLIDVTKMPYKQVCVYRDNMVTPIDYANVIHSLAKHYNEAQVLVEVNDIGEQVSTTLFEDFEYENNREA